MRCDPPAKFVALDGDAPDIGARCSQILVPECILRLDDAAGLLSNYPGKGVTGLMDVYPPQSCLARIPLQVLVEGVRGERRARLPRSVRASSTAAARYLAR